ncbi:MULTISPECIES: GDSL-type esterase/lipase family protein [unclassified Streptomyces]|uniref:GDSL-type esterase/lipase family protein n=1 Tax=unclassified Streptomyces TaxID=2593676 RepID=UPI002E2AED43|nr:GDSL-type esterase/lipase family protein [Streptomyces sp. NBC_01439]
MTKLCIIGNSVAASRTPKEAPFAGWGQFLGEYLTPYFEVKNYARDAMTARSYYTERFLTLLNQLTPGDVVAVDFGGVEQRIDKPGLYHSHRELREFLHLYLAAIRTEGAVPVLLTPAVRCVFEPDGTVADTRDGYPQVVREVAAETGTPLVDLNLMTARMLHELGPQRARQYYRWVDAGEHPNHPDGLIDASHFNEAGAREVARLVAIGLHQAAGLPYGMVNTEAVAVAPGYPPLLTEFTVESPERALQSPGGVVAEPVFAGPRPGQAVSAMQKFWGTAAPGTSYLLFFEQGVYIGGTRVNAEGKWTWRRAVKWVAGERVIQAVGITDQGLSAVATLPFAVWDSVPPPIVLGPREGNISGPRPRFSGTAVPGVSQVMIMEGDRLIAAAPVQKDGTWKVTHQHDWRPGSYSLEFVAIFSAIHSKPAPYTLRVHGVPEGNWIRESTMSRVPCDDKCDHMPFAGRW